MIEMTWPMYLRSECRFIGRIVRLTKFEADVLSVLLLNRGKPVQVNHIIEAIYNPDIEPERAHNCVIVVKHRLTQKLPGLIHSHGCAVRRGFTGWVVDLPTEERLAA